MSRATYRPRNKCRQCGYTWAPRGHDLSRRCPGCGSGDVTHSFGGLGFVGLVVGLILVYAAMKGSCAGTPDGGSNLASVAPGGSRRTTVSSLVQPTQTAAPRSCTVYERAAPRTAQVAQLRAGAPIVVLREWNGWRFVRTSDGTTGWTGPVCWQ